jgi:hypothetical protein
VLVAKPDPGALETGNSRFGFKQRSEKFRLPNDARQRAASDRIVEGNWNGERLFPGAFA